MNRNDLEQDLKSIPGFSKADVNALLIAFDAGFLEFVCENRKTITKTDAARFIKIMTDEYGLAEYKAEWAVLKWAEIFGCTVETGNTSILYRPTEDVSKKKIYCVQCHTKWDVDLKQCPACKAPLFGQAYKDPGLLGDFTRFVTSFTEKDLFSLINTLYNDIKGRCNDHPRMGYNGGVVFADTLLLLHYLKNEKPGGDVGNLLALLFKIGMGFAQEKGNRFDDSMDRIVGGTRMVDLEDFHNVYLYLETFYFEKMNSFEFCDRALDNADLILNQRMEPVSGFSTDYECLQYFDSWGLNLISQL